MAQPIETLTSVPIGPANAEGSLPLLYASGLLTAVQGVLETVGDATNSPRPGAWSLTPSMGNLGQVELRPVATNTAQMGLFGVERGCFGG